MDTTDRDKTPIAPQPKTGSTISRLESKYSDVLGRVARRRQEELTNREKTLEPDRPYMNPVTRSATTMLNGDRAVHAYQKERTPYKLTRQRQKYGDTNASTETASKSRTDTKPIESNPRRSRAAALSSTTTTSDYDPIRRKDTLYDAYAPRSDRVQYRYGDHSVRSKAITKDLSYVSGADKENHYKSKYDPAKLYAEQSAREVDDTFDTSPAVVVTSERDRERKRALRSYKRTCTANDRRHTTNYKDVLNQLDDERPAVSRYSQRQSSGAYQRSQTQQFFDAETDGTSTVDNPVVSEREARRKEIQGLIMKYAQLDDVYNKATEDRANNNNRAAPIALNGHDNSLHGSTSMSSMRGPEMLALSKTQSVAAMSSLRSRIPKTLSTFVRHCDPLSLSLSLSLSLTIRPESLFCLCVLRLDFLDSIFLVAPYLLIGDSNFFELVFLCYALTMFYIYYL